MMNESNASGCFNSLIKSLTVCAIFTSFALTVPVQAQIAPTGLTDMNIQVSGNTTNISTNCARGGISFNSFSQFNVGSGKIVNLQLPGNASYLINVVHEKATNINGTLNVIKNGSIYGHMFLINPYGIHVGSGGVVNTMNFTAITPTHKYVDSFFDGVNSPNGDSIIQLFSGKVDINSEAEFVNSGQINASGDIQIAAGVFINKGEINTGAKYVKDDKNIGNFINTNRLSAEGEMNIEDGEIKVVAVKDAVNNAEPQLFNGKPVLNQPVQLATLNAQNVDIKAGKNIIGGKYGRINSSGIIDLKASKGGIDDIRVNNDGLFQFISANAYENISITQTKGSMVLNSVSTKYGDVSLKASDGIYGLGLLGGGNIRGKNISLVAENGSIGNDNDPINISSSGKLNATALNGPINLRSGGHLNIDKVKSKHDVSVIAAGNIKDVNPLSSRTSIYGKNITLTSLSGRIGERFNYLNVQTNYASAGGLLTATAESGDIQIRQNNMNLHINNVTAGGVAAISARGSIYQSHINAAATSVKAAKVFLNSDEGSIGHRNSALKTDVTSSRGLEARAAENIYIFENAGDLYIDNVESGGRVDISNHHGGVYAAHNRGIHIEADSLFIFGNNGVGTQNAPLVVDTPFIHFIVGPQTHYINISDENN